MADEAPMKNEAGWNSSLLVRRALAVLVGGVFLYAGAIKVIAPISFTTDIFNYQILSWPIAVRLAFYLPWLEIFCGLALIFHRLFAGAVALTTGLMLVFLVASVVAKARGINIDCGCFGSGISNLSFTWHLVIDFVLLGILAFLWWDDRRALAPATVG